MKIVINGCYGGFSVSPAVLDELGFDKPTYSDTPFGRASRYLRNEDFGIEADDYNAYRADPRFVAAVEKLGTRGASGAVAQLVIAEVPDGADWYIEEYDGTEKVVWSMSKINNEYGNEVTP